MLLQASVKRVGLTAFKWWQTAVDPCELPMCYWSKHPLELPPSSESTLHFVFVIIHEEKSDLTLLAYAETLTDFTELAKYQSLTLFVKIEARVLHSY